MPVLLVAATGGHLTQMDRLARRIPGYDDDAVWVTFDTEQSRSLLAGRRHVFVPYTAPRDAYTAMRNIPQADAIIRRVRPSLVVSTGNAIAVSFLPVARLRKTPAAYIESAARTKGPSLSGRILRQVPGIQLFTQNHEWARPPWRYVGSLFEEYQVEEPRSSRTIRRVLVTLGTIPFPFTRLVRSVNRITPPGCEVRWQFGATMPDGTASEGQSYMSASTMAEEMRHADAVIAHAGIGSAMACLDAGKVPILIPREKRYGEHVDDHQREIAEVLSDRGLAVYQPVESLTWDAVVEASKRRVVRRRCMEPLLIETGRYGRTLATAQPSD